MCYSKNTYLFRNDKDNNYIRKIVIIIYLKHTLMKTNALFLLLLIALSFFLL